MVRPAFMRGAIVGIVTAGSLALGTGVALAGDNNGDGQIDRGDTGTAVWCVQHVVHTYFGISIGSSGEDGHFGANTESGVKTYQSRHGGLSVDGKVGHNTGHAMFTDVNSIRRTASQTGDRELLQDTGNWLNICPKASNVFQ